MDSLWVGLGGFLGALARYGLAKLFAVVAPGLPYGTLCANIGGSFLLGVVQVLALEQFFLTPRARLLFGVGFCGSFTTFSTYVKETFVFVEKKLFLLAGIYLLGSVAFCLLGSWFGVLLTRAVFAAARERARFSGGGE